MRLIFTPHALCVFLTSFTCVFLCLWSSCLHIHLSWHLYGPSGAMWSDKPHPGAAGWSWRTAKEQHSSMKAHKHTSHTHTHTHPLGHFPVLISKYICSSSCWGPAGKTVGGIEDERKSRMHGELRLYTLLPLTHTYTRLFTTSDIRTGKVDSAEGSGMEQAGSAHNSQHTHCCCSRAGEGGKAWLMSFMPSCLTWKWIKLLCVIKCFVRVDLLVILVKGMKRDCSARYLKPLSQNTKHVYGNSHSSK